MLGVVTCRCYLHVFAERGEVGLLLGNLLLQLQKLLLLALADGVVLVCLLAALEGITVMSELVSVLHRRDAALVAYPWPPVLGGAPVSPADMALAVTLKARREMGVAARPRRGAFTRAWRYMMDGYGWGFAMVQAREYVSVVCLTQRLASDECQALVVLYTGCFYQDWRRRRKTYSGCGNESIGSIGCDRMKLRAT
jgi:hypothetical protein